MADSETLAAKLHGSSSPVAHHPLRAVRVVGWATAILLTAVWVRMTSDALALRRVVGGYEDVHGPAGLGLRGQWTDHFRTFHDDLVAVGADYFYPFANATFVPVAALWLIAGFAATTGHRALRIAVLSAGLAAMLFSLVFFSTTLLTYINVTD